MSKVQLAGNANGTGIFTIASPNSNTDRTLTLPDNTGTLLTQNSQPSFASTIGVGGATPATSGAGITFPATQSASSNANTLDDYEEGTFTPTWNGGSVTNNGCGYIKIGGSVFVMYDITFGSSASSSTSVLSVPFGAVFLGASYSSGSINYTSYGSGSYTIDFDAGFGATTPVAIRLAPSNSAATCSQLAGSRWIFTVQYPST